MAEIHTVTVQLLLGHFKSYMLFTRWDLIRHIGKQCTPGLGHLFLRQWPQFFPIRTDQGWWLTYYFFPTKFSKENLVHCNADKILCTLNMMWEENCIKSNLSMSSMNTIISHELSWWKTIIFSENIEYDISGTIVQKAKPLFRFQCTSLVSRKPFSHLNVGLSL